MSNLQPPLNFAEFGAPGINHWTLFRKLIDCQVPLLIVRILIFWHQMQLVCIKWGTAVSQYFRISNGVRQGGILSPKLFALYMNGLSSALSHCKAGCYINEQCMNHIMYADDICVMAPTAILLYKSCLMCVLNIALQTICYSTL